MAGPELSGGESDFLGGCDPLTVPPGREPFSILPGTKTVIDQEDDAAIFFRTDGSAGGLHDPVDSGKSVGVVETGSALLLAVLPNQIAFQADLGQAHPNNGDADETFAGQIDSFAENAAEHREGDQRLSGVRTKFGNEMLALSF